MPLRFVTENIKVDVKYKKVSTPLMIPRPPIKMRANGKLVEKVRVVADRRFLKDGKELASEIKLVDPETQEQVPQHETVEILEHYKYRYLNEEGREVDDEEIQYFAVREDGSEQEVSPFERTTELSIPEENWIPSTSVDEFLVESLYELFHSDDKVARQLFEEAERRLKEDKVGITTFSWGRGFIQYYAMVEPIMREGKFVWLLKLTQTKAEYQHMMDIPAKVKVPIRKAPTLQVLPPVQALVVTSQRKKKKAVA